MVLKRTMLFTVLLIVAIWVIRAEAIPDYTLDYYVGEYQKDVYVVYKYLQKGEVLDWHGFQGGTDFAGEPIAKELFPDSEGVMIEAGQQYFFKAEATVHVSFDWSISVTGPDRQATVDVLHGRGGYGEQFWYETTYDGPKSDHFSADVPMYDNEGVIGLWIRSYIWRGTTEDGSASASITNLTIDGQSPSPVPEPCTMLLVGSGLAGIGAFRRRFKR